MAKPEEKNYIRKEAAKGAGKWFLGSTLFLGAGLGAAGAALYFTGYLAVIAAVSVVGLPLLPVIGGAAGVIVLAATMIGLFKNRAAAKAAVKAQGGVPEAKSKAKETAKVTKHVARPKTKAFLWFLGASVLLGAGAAALYFTGALAVVAASAVFGVPALPLLAAGAGLFALTAGVIGYFSNRARKAKSTFIEKKEGDKLEADVSVKKSSKKGWRKGLAIAAGVTLPLLAIGGAVAAGVFYTGSFAALGATLTAFLMPVVPMLPMIGIGVAAVAAVALITVAAVAITRRVKANKAKKLAAKQARLEGNVDAAVQAAVDAINALETPSALNSFQQGWQENPLAVEMERATSAAGYDAAKKQGLIDTKIQPAHQARVIHLQNSALETQGVTIRALEGSVLRAQEAAHKAELSGSAARAAADAAKQQATKAAAENAALRTQIYDAFKAKLTGPYQAIKALVNACDSLQAIAALEAKVEGNEVQALWDFDFHNEPLTVLDGLIKTGRFDPARTQIATLLNKRKTELQPKQEVPVDLGPEVPAVVNGQGAPGVNVLAPAANDADADAAAQLRAAGQTKPKK